MQWRLKKTVALIGMMGAGKSAVGGALARTLDVPFLDSDAAIVEASNMPIPDLFARFGEPFFRQKEAQVIARLMGDAPAILSTGGGAFLSAENRETMRTRGIAVWLKAEVDLLWDRVRHKDTRPLLRTPDPRGTLARLVAERGPVYALADLTVEAHRDYSVQEMAEKVIGALATRPDVLERAEA